MNAMNAMNGQPLTNWAGNVTFSTQELHRPRSIQELQAVVAGSRRLRVLGSGHSFNTIADSTGELVTVAGLPSRLELDEGRRTVTVDAGRRFGELAQAIDARGWALHNLGSLPHISVAGAIATGTHGSGRTNGNLASAVSGLDLVTAEGDTVRIERGQDGFEGAVVSLGSLGVVTAVTLDLQPRYDVEQRVYEGLALATVRENLLDVLDAAYSVSVFLTWRAPLEAQVWVRHRTDQGDWADQGDWTEEEFFGASPADGPRNPVPGMDPRSCTVQDGTPGSWHERLPCFRIEATPSAGDELQSEYFVPREHAVQALDAVAELAELVAPLLMVAELRTVAADDLWLSEAYQQDSLALHFTWLNDQQAVTPVLEALEARLDPLGARPHWGKVFTTTPTDLAARYPRMPEASKLFTTYDPQGKLRNDFVDRYLFSAPRPGVPGRAGPA